MESTKPYNFRLSHSKYANLIDQSDVKWWADLQAKRLAAGEQNSKSNTTETKNENEIKEKKQISLKSFTYSPILCPIADCEILFLPNDLVMHFLSYHSDTSPMQRIFENQRLVITILPFEMNVDEIICVGLISFGGKNKAAKGSETGRALLWFEQNLTLHQRFQHLSHDYPILLLACIVPMDVFISKKHEILRIGRNNICPPMLVLWLAGAPSNAKIFCTFTAFDEYCAYSRSAINGVRSLCDSQSPYDFCNKDHNYFRLTFKELYSLAADERILKIELCFQEIFDDNGN